MDRSIRLVCLTVASSCAASIVVSSLPAQVELSPQVFPHGECPAEIVAHDVDGDGDLDVLYTNHHSHDIRSLTNDGSGVFTPGPATPVPGLIVPHPISLTLADFDGNGLLDIAVVGHLNDEGHRFLADGFGNWVDPQPLPAGAFPLHIDSGDYDENGVVDLVTANRDDDSFSLIRGTGGGSFAAQEIHAAGDGPTSLIAVDLDLDGHLDVAVANSFSGTISIHHGTGTGGFDAAVVLGGLPIVSHLIAEDVDGDGDLDLVACHDAGVSLLLATAARSYGAAQLLHATALPRATLVVDLVGGPARDLVIAASEVGLLVFLEGDGGGGFTLAGSTPAGVTPFGLATADLDGNGLPDLMVTDETGHAVHVLSNLGPSPVFTRGDANADGSFDISDPIATLGRLFGSGHPGIATFPCADAEDVNDDGLVNIADPVSSLTALFTGGASPPPPFALCGSDPTLDPIGCDQPPGCP